MKLNLENVTKTYGKLAALDGMSLAPPEGVRCLVLIGPSGGGKSTLLRVIGGLETPDSGTVVVNDQALSYTASALLDYRRKNGFLFQAFNLFPHLTALRNITLPLEKVHQQTSIQAEETAREVLDRFGLADHAEKLPVQLSGGQQQRVGIARAISTKPQLLILDEPTSALDPEMTAEVLDLIEELAEAGQDIILSTHEMGFARAVGDHVVFLAEGKVLEEGTADAVFDQSASPEARKFLSRVMRY